MRDRSSPLIALGSVLSRSAALVNQNSVGRQLWQDVVGRRIALRSKPERLEGHVLFVTVSSSAWAQELSLLAGTIIGRLVQRGQRIKNLRFRVGKVEPLPNLGIRSRIERVPLDAELKKRLDALDDPKLQQLITEAATRRVHKKK